MFKRSKKFALIAGTVTVAAAAIAIPMTGFADSATQEPAVQDSAAELTAEQRAFVKKVVKFTNQHRVKHGCKKLELKANLSAPAQKHSKDMARGDFMSHTGSDGRGPGTRVDDSAYQGDFGAENVGAGYATAKGVVKAWMNSEGHRKNILNCKLDDIGVGYAENSDGRYGTYWTQDFGYR